jgi:hypothetical protein
LGQIRLGGLPSNVSGPALWGGYLIQLSGWSDAVSAESGVGAAGPTVTAPGIGSGLISFWNGSGYTTCTVYQAGCPNGGANFPVATLVRNTSVDGNTVNVTMSAAITAGGTSTVQVPASCSGTCNRNQATATSGSPLSGTITYSVSVNSQVVCNLTMTVNLGSLLVNTTYQAAPTP